MIRYILVVFIFFSLISCKQNTTPLQHAGNEVNTVDSTSETLKNYVHSYVLFNAKANENVTGLMTNLEIGEQGTNKLIFVCTTNDCNTCINEQLTNMVRLISPTNMKNNVTIVTDPDNLKKIQVTWRSILKHTRVVIKDIPYIAKNLQYDGAPIYYVLSPKKHTILSSYVIIQAYPDMTLDILKTYNSLYIGR